MFYNHAKFKCEILRKKDENKECKYGYKYSVHCTFSKLKKIICQILQLLYSLEYQKKLLRFSKLGRNIVDYIETFKLF
jgi:hypothetical protein